MNRMLLRISAVALIASLVGIYGCVNVEKTEAEKKPAAEKTVTPPPPPPPLPVAPAPAPVAPVTPPAEEKK